MGKSYFYMLDTNFLLVIEISNVFPFSVVWFKKIFMETFSIDKSLILT